MLAGPRRCVLCAAALSDAVDHRHEHLCAGCVRRVDHWLKEGMMERTVALVPSGHVDLSPSKAHRWIHCPGSIAAEAPFPDTSSKYADEGSAAHLLAAKCLGSPGVPASSFVGETFPEYPKFPVTQDMAEAVEVYVDYVLGIWAFCDMRWVEEKVMLDPETFHLPEPIGGTSDAGGIDATEGILHVTDLKFGRGVVVEAEDNEQFKLYALAAYGALSPEDREVVRAVRLHVIQPRAEHEAGPIRTADLSVMALFTWAQEVMVPAAWAAKQPNAAIVPGEHCRFCKAKPTCVAFRQQAFERMPFTVEELATPGVVPAALPAEMTPEQVSVIWAKLGLLEEWVAAFRSFVYHEVSNGRAIPGVALTRKRTNRNWLDEGMVAEFCADAPGIFQAPKVLSVAQLEKYCKQSGMPFPEHLVVKDEGAWVLCAAEDKDAHHPLPIAAAATKFNLEDL